MRDDFSDIKVGDKVGFYSHYTLPYIKTVTKVTAQFFDVGSKRFRKRDGYEPGGYRYNPEVAKHVTPEFMSAYTEAHAEDKRKTMAAELSAAVRDLPQAALEEIGEVVKRYTTGQPDHA